MRRRLFSLWLACLLAVGGALPALAGGAPEQAEEVLGPVEEPVSDLAIPTIALEGLPVTSAILIEQSSGKVLYELNPDEPQPPASITKVMTLLLVMRALDEGRFTLEDMVTCSTHASTMGGSQIWLKEGEQMSVNDLLKATCISSANDAAVALAEQVAGSEEAFVEQMNQTARELGMQNTTFHNACGLDAEGHLSTARDIAIMSRELLGYPKITEYSTIWMDTLRGGATQLVNTNKLVRFYNGTTGLKTGTTSGAGFCLSASATRGELSLIAVVMGAKTGDERFAAAKALLEHGFANYTTVAPPAEGLTFAPVPVRGGVLTTVAVASEAPERLLVKKEQAEGITSQIELAESLDAPVEQGQTVGTVRVYAGEELLCEYPVKAAEAVEKMTLGRAFLMLLRAMISQK